MQTSCIAHKKSIQPFVSQNVWPGTLKQQSCCAICLAHSHTYCERLDNMDISLFESIYKEKHTNTSAHQCRTIFTLFNFHVWLLRFDNLQSLFTHFLLWTLKHFFSLFYILYWKIYAAACIPFTFVFLKSGNYLGISVYHYNLLSNHVHRKTVAL